MFKKLIAVQNELKAPKGQYNKFGNYHYRSCEDILTAVKPILEKANLSMTITDDVVVVGDRFYIKATVTVFDIEKPELNTSVSAFAREPLTQKGMADSQVTGTASSYARKYALNGMFLIDDTKDADTDEYANQTANQPTEKAKTKKPTTTNVQKETPEEEKLNEEMRNSVDPVYLPTKDNKPSKEQMDKLHSEMERTGVAESVLTQMYQVKSIEQMDSAMVVSALNKFKVTGDKR